MMQKTPTAQSQPERKNGHKPETAVLTEQTTALAGIAELSGGLVGAQGNGNIEKQKVWLGDARLQAIQKQSMAAQIGQRQGNQHVQRLILSLQRQTESPGQTDVTSPAQMVPPVAVNEADVVRQLMAQGESSENKLTNELYFRRHEEVRGIKLKRGSPGAREWLDIRNTIVRPALQPSGGTSAGTKPKLTEMASGTYEPAGDPLFEEVLKPLKQKLLDTVATQEGTPAKAESTAADMQLPATPGNTGPQAQTGADQAAGKKVQDTLKVAMELEKELRKKHPDYGQKGGFQGYGSSGPDQYVCTTFARKVLAEAGYDVSGGIWKRINVDINWQKELGKKNPNKEEQAAALKKLVEAGDPRTKGIVSALVESKQGTEISVDQLQPGDFIQYWYPGKDGGLGGHVVQVREVIPVGDNLTVKVHGSHGMTQGVSTISLTLKKKGKLVGWLKKIYCVRPMGSQANRGTASAGASTQGTVQPKLVAPGPDHIRLHSIHRQAMATQSGQLRGNGHLPRTNHRPLIATQLKPQMTIEPTATDLSESVEVSSLGSIQLTAAASSPPSEPVARNGSGVLSNLQRETAPAQTGAAAPAAEQPEEEGLLSSLTNPKKLALKEVASFAKDLPGYHLLTVILGRDPITDQAVKRAPKLILKEALSLVPGGDQIFKNLDESGAIDRAFAWLEEQFAQLQLTWESIKGLFTRAWDAFSITDLVHPFDVWEKIKGIFLEPIGRIANFMIAAGKKVLEFVFEAAMEKLGGSQVLALLKKAGAAFQAIIQDPIGFLGNLITGVKQGFLNFVANIGTHIKHGLVSWLFGQLAQTGIELPKSFDMPSILSMVMQVLGLTWPNIRAQAVKVLGEKVVGVLEGAFKIFTIIKDQGLGGLWEYVKEQLSNLKEMVLGSVKDMVITQVIQAGVQWVLSLLGGPVGALIKAVKGIYDIVMWLIDNGKRIMSLVEAVVDSFGAIASGAVGVAAKFIEKALANAIPTAIGFLASLLGIGDLGNKIKGIITKVQEQVQKGIGWVLTKAKSFAGKVLGKVKGLFGKKEEKPVISAVKKDIAVLTSKQYQNVEAFDSALKTVFAKHKPQGLKSLYVKGVNDDPEKPFAILAEASPATPVTLVKWKDLFELGAEPKGAAEKFAKAGDSTYAMLLMNGKPVTSIKRSEKEAHAERKVVESGEWKQALDQAEKAAHMNPATETTFRLVINRTPCHGLEIGCTGILKRALDEYWPRFKNPAARRRVNFYLVATGVYETKGELHGRKPGQKERAEQGPTTADDLFALASAGWHLQGLQVGEKPTSRGAILSDFVQKLLQKLKLVKTSG